MVNAQEWLEGKYPNKGEVKEIKRGENKLERERHKEKLTGELIIADFPQVEEINVDFNELTQLHLCNCSQLTGLDCGYNKLTKLTITNCPNLQTIYAHYNNFSSDLAFVNHLVNLKELYLWNNNFTGSLEPLQNLRKLEWLNIEYTKISQGIEFLPASIVDFRCRGTEWEKEIEPFGSDAKKMARRKRSEK